ncbi:hypothetical protein SLEP1_g45305 [Rubroshorea leprosula]|uniref:DUF1421 domain-containing protein n=1 Tax=Rubroshorea leprosula TaxID=152421 RepID=A0AAV5LKU6_9ROSI|nr:hypothetical protein SLEP1_g45305 [Rubroshorea leprosula]
MNASQFMDKQIMDLTASSSSNDSISGKDFMDLMSHTKDEGDHGNPSKTTSIAVVDNGIKMDEIFPSYDFQPIRPSTNNLDEVSGIGGSANSRIWSSVDSKTTKYGSLHSIEPAKILEKDRNAVDMGMVAEIDRTMKKHSDSLMHVLEGVSARLTQLETRTRELEDSVDDLKVSVGNSQGSMDGKMRQLENILREVQTGVQVVKDKQEVMEAQLQLGKLQVSKADQPSETQSAMLTDFVKQAASAPQQSHQPLPPAGSYPQSQPQVPASPVIPPPALPQQSLPPPAQHPNQFPQNQILSVLQRDPSYFPPPVQTQEAPNQQYQLPPIQQPQPPPAAPPHQPPQPPSQPQYSQPPGAPLQPQHQPPLGHHPEEPLPPYNPSQGYAPNLRQPPSQQPSGSAPAQQYYGAPPHMYDPPPSRPSSGFSTGFIPPSVPTEPYAYGGTSSQYSSGATMKAQQIPPLPMPQSGGSGYPQLPTARVLPHALPTASGVGSGSSSPRSGNRVPIDDVIDKVTSMGFPRDHVRATVRKLTESGQSVDLNMVLDKLMNDGEVQLQRGWFGR